MPTFITIEVSNGENVVRSVHPSAEAAATAVETAKPAVWTAVTDPVIDDVEPQWYYTAGDGRTQASVSPVSALPSVPDRRRELRVLWLRRESEFSALWGFGRVYAARVGKNCSAASVDDNLSDNDRFAILLAEAQIPGDQFFIQHDATTWTATFVGDGATKYYSTADDGTPTEESTVTLNPAADFNWVAWLRETD